MTELLTARGVAALVAYYLSASDGAEEVLDRAANLIQVWAGESGSSLAMVREFHEKFRQPVEDRPAEGREEPLLHAVAGQLRSMSLGMLEVHRQRLDDGQEDSPYLRAHLHMEELAELFEALAEPDLVAQLDALVDMQYVLDGSFLTLGFGAVKDEAFHRVHEANMLKVVPEGPYERIRKPEGWVPPELVDLVR